MFAVRVAFWGNALQGAGKLRAAARIGRGAFPVLFIGGIFPAFVAGWAADNFGMGRGCFAFPDKSFRRSLRTAFGAGGLIQLQYGGLQPFVAAAGGG